MYLNHTIDDTLGAYHRMYKMDIINIFHSKSKNPPHWISNKEDFYVYKGMWRDVCLIM